MSVFKSDRPFVAAPFKPAFGAPHDTLAEAKAAVQQALKDGSMITCECCGQTVKKYSRKIYKTMLTCLAIIAKAGPDGIDAQQIGQRMAKKAAGEHHSKLALWGLAKQDPFGRWHATSRGRLFLAKRISIPTYVYVYNGVVHGFSEKEVIVTEIDPSFNYGEILDPENLDV